MNPVVTAFMHEPTGSLTYVVQEPDGPHCAVVDPVLDFRLFAVVERDHRPGAVAPCGLLVAGGTTA